MKKLKSSILALLSCCSILHGQGIEKPHLAGELFNNKAREQEFMDWGLGMFVHWSFDSQLGSVISHHMSYASEKHIDRVINELPKTFNPRQYDPNEWMELAKLAGVKYMVFTTKHHSGFCMWDTKTTDFNIMNTPYKKDTVKMFVDACRAHDIKVGFYFSPEDWIFNHTQDMVARGGKLKQGHKDKLTKYNYTQLDELFGGAYGDIDVAFFDGGEKEVLAQYVHKISPKTIVTRGEIVTPEQKLPAEPIPGPWETCFTLGTQWHYKPTNEDYKTGSRLINMLIETRAKGGNLLINMGPHPNGQIPIEQEERFRELALWMFVNDESIHNVRACSYAGAKKGAYYTQSQDGKYIYAHLVGLVDDKAGANNNNWGRFVRKENILLEGIEVNENTKVTVLGQDDQLDRYSERNQGTLKISCEPSEDGAVLSVARAQRLYNNRRWPNAVVVRLENAKFKR